VLVSTTFSRSPPACRRCARARLVDHVDGLVGQVTVVDVRADSSAAAFKASSV
jgi:hypothetical protein